MSDVRSKTSADMVREAKSRVENLTPDQVEAEIGNPDTLLVDIRDTAERAKNGVIPGAIHIDRGMLEFRADPSNSNYYNPELRQDRRVILHCASGGRSALAASLLQEMGYTDVAHLDGGLNAWRDSGKPVADGSKS